MVTKAVSNVPQNFTNTHNTIGIDRPRYVAPEATEPEDDLESRRNDKGALRPAHYLLEFLRESHENQPQCRCFEKEKAKRGRVPRGLKRAS